MKNALAAVSLSVQDGSKADLRLAQKELAKLSCKLDKSLKRCGGNAELERMVEAATNPG